jgi:hypothetical protein
MSGSQNRRASNGGSVGASAPATATAAERLGDSDGRGADEPVGGSGGWCPPGATLPAAETDDTTSGDGVAPLDAA